MPIIIPGSGYTLAEYRASMQARGYDGASDAHVDLAINEARRRMFSDHRWSWMENISTPTVATVGVPEVSLTAIPDLLWLDAVRLENFQEVCELDYLPEQEFRTKETRFPSTGRPLWWTAIGGTIRLYPTPDFAYGLALDFTTTPPDLSGPTDVDDVPRLLAAIVVWGATPSLAYRQREFTAMQYAEAQYTGMLRTAVAQDNVRQRQTSRQVKSGYWGS